jgi:hypothetical protein
VEPDAACLKKSLDTPAVKTPRCFSRIRDAAGELASRGAHADDWRDLRLSSARHLYDRSQNAPGLGAQTMFDSQPWALDV